MITDRQIKILNGVIQEYIESAQPVSSYLLETKYNFGVSPATIRGEMQKLTDNGFLCQPHVSAGRIPTDNGYRFYVNNIAAELTETKEFSEIENWINGTEMDIFQFIRSLTKNLATASSVLALVYLDEGNILWKEGWEKVFKEPEFYERNKTVNFVDFLANFEKSIQKITPEQEIEIYIGKENSFSDYCDFSVILSGCSFPRKKKGIVSVLGPKRMSYEKNINLINSLTKLLNVL